MKKIFLFSILISLFLVSCSNLHFTNTTSVSMYLPELGGNAGGSVGARVISFPQSYDDSIYYYDVQLKQNDRIKYSKVSAGGTTITFTGINAGDYEIECNACVKKNFDFTVFARKERSFSVLKGQSVTVDLELLQTPFITKQLEPHFFNSNNGDGVEFKVLSSSLEGTKDTDYIVNWYIDDILATDFSSYCTSNENYGDFEKIEQLIVSNNSSDIGVSIGPHKLYAKIINLSDGSYIKTNTVDVYFTPSSSYTITPVDMDVHFKGDVNNYDYAKSLSASDFYGTITYEIEQYVGEKKNIDIFYNSLPDDVSVNYPMDDVGDLPHTLTYGDIEKTITIKRTYYQNLKENLNTINSEINMYPGQEYQELRAEFTWDGVLEYETVLHEWYSCDENGNNMVLISNEDIYSLQYLEEPGYYYFRCRVTITGLSDACLNAPGGKVTFMVPDTYKVFVQA